MSKIIESNPYELDYEEMGYPKADLTLCGEQSQVEFMRNRWEGVKENHDCHKSPEDSCRTCEKYEKVMSDLEIAEENLRDKGAWRDEIEPDELNRINK